MNLPFVPAVGAEIFDLRPDYAAVSLVADGLVNVASHPDVERYVAQTVAHPALPPWGEGHLEAWRAAYRAFGAKPQRTPCSMEALQMRVDKERRLPGINAIVDLYNAISVRYAIPIGGEDIDAYVGLPRLVRAAGTESFDTMREGASVAEAVPAGEVVWMDELGVTCRRWNWRQGIRTRIGLETHRAWFVLERLEPMPLAAAREAAVVLATSLRLLSSEAGISACLIDRSGRTEID